MPSQEDRRPSKVRSLLEATGIPFAVADYRQQVRSAPRVDVSTPFMGTFKKLGHIEEVHGVLHVKPSLLRVADAIDVSQTAQPNSQSGR